ncbi:DNA polymerase Y family protein [Sphingorhabdus sp.]|uniref:Y-family DNA polymerase n=1 Tax=Sphingorhabdus sp. TaxID=1902408 RepID=UPI0032B784D6
MQGPDRRTAGSLPDAPLAFVAKVKGALRLCAVDALAQCQGIVPGLTLTDARARQPALALANMDKDADRHWLDQQMQRCTAWTPLVTIAGGDGITLDITGTDHLFGGEAGLSALVEDTFASVGVTLRLAIAATPEAAQALARHASLPVEDECLAIRSLPVAALGLEEAALALRRVGLKTIGDLVARPAASIAVRFGMEAVIALRRLLGEEQAPIIPLVQPVPLRFERRFAEPIGHQPSIAACFADLLRKAACVLEERDLGGRCFVLTLFRSDGQRQRLEIKTGLPTRDPAIVLRLFDERITTLADPLDPGFGYDTIALALPVTEPLVASQPRLDGQEGRGATLAELIDRLSTRLGADSLRRLAPQDSHVPEQAQFALPALHAPAPASWPVPALDEPPLRPLFLFDPPQPVEVIAEVPDGPPHRFRWQRTLREVCLYEGPERISAEWWRRRGGEEPGKGGLTRDYYRIEDAHGRRYWIFRHGLYSEKPDPRHGPRWYVHGLFA